VLYAVAAILRLARFNVHKEEHVPTSFFSGLPTPMAAGTIATYFEIFPMELFFWILLGVVASCNRESS